MRLERTLAVAALGLALLSLLVALALQILQTGPGPGYFLIAGVALAIISAVLEPSAVIGLARSRRGRSGAYSLAFAVLVLGTLFFVNVFASQGQQHLDLTGAQLHSLAPKSKAVLRDLRDDLRVIVFAASSDPSRQQLLDQLSLYQDASSRVHVRTVDPSADVAEAQALGVTSSGSIVLEYGDRKPVVLAPGSETEQDITGGILKLELNRQLTLCWASGEGERDLQSTDNTTGYSSAASALAGEDFTPRQLVLSEVTSVPSECNLVAVVGPTVPLSSAAQSALIAYASAGGRLFVATDPWRSDVIASLNAVLKHSGLQFDGGLVIDDPAHTVANRPAYPLVVSYGSSPVTKDLSNQVSIFPGTTGIAGTLDAGGVALASSSSQSYEAPDPRQDVSRQPGDKSGPFDLLVTVQRDLGGGKRERLVVSGSSALAQNQVVPPQAGTENLALLINSFDWLTGEDSLIALPAKPAGPLPLSLTAAQSDFDLFVTLFLVPLLITFGGFLVWWWRRRTTAVPGSPTGPETAPADTPPPAPATPG